MNNNFCTTNVKTISTLYRRDWSKIEESKIEEVFSGVDFSEYDLRRITLPKYKNLFQIIKDKSLRNTRLPESDYSIYNFSNVDIEATKFTKNSKLPSNLDFFQKVFEKSIHSTVLPELDYSIYNFSGVRINAAFFPEKSTIKITRTLFQDFSGGHIANTKFPKGDYRICSFKDVKCRFVEFTRDSLLPEYKDFFKDISESDKSRARMKIGSSDFKLTDNVIKNIHNYSLDNIYLDLRGYEANLTDIQLSLIKTKYREKIGKAIVLPEKGLCEENNTNDSAIGELFI